MKEKLLTLLTALLIASPYVNSQEISNQNDTDGSGFSWHPWYGKKVGYIGDSITDPKNYKDEVKKKYWAFLEEWLGISPYVYGVSGRQWNDVPRQAQKLKNEHGDEVDAIIVFMGTNDFNSGIPIGEWFTEINEEVVAAHGEMKKPELRKKRVAIMSDSTYKGRINIGIKSLKELFPDKQVVLLTPLHRSTAIFNEKNVQPDESYQNKCEEYFDRYINAIKEAGNIWGVPVIDLNSLTGMNPMVGEQLIYFRDPSTDRLHPSTEGQRRMARTLLYQLLTIPASF